MNLRARRKRADAVFSPLLVRMIVRLRLPVRGLDRFGLELELE
jgi:hypothetical protein